MRTKRGRIGPLFAIGALAALSTATLARLWLDLVEVRGSSMAPALLANDWLLVERWTYTRRQPRPDEVVLAADPRDPQRELVKRVAGVGSDGVRLAGDNAAASTDSAAFGALPVALVRWRVVARCWPPRRIGPVAPFAPPAEP
jgi:nickel-type superoxide dismutase maturation protease